MKNIFQSLKSSFIFSSQKGVIPTFNGGLIIIVVLTFLLGWQLGHRDYQLRWENYKPDIKISNQQAPQDVDIDFKLFWDTWDLVHKKYIDKKALDPQKLYYGAIQGMVAAIGDPYTVFLPPQAQKSTKEQLSGSFEGVGMQLEFNKDKRLVVSAPLKDTPAERGGVKAGDIILKIGDKDATNLSLPEAVSLIRGPKGTTVTINLYSEGDSKPRDVTLTRDNIVVKSVTYQPKQTKSGKKVAYIRISSFGEKTQNEWNEAVSDSLADGAQAVIVDVRNDPGGYLDAAIYIGSEFLADGVVVSQEDYLGNKQDHTVVRAGKMLKLPMTVLINKGSASASEILAGAMQDRGRGKLIGTQSFGKGTIQSAEDLPENTGIHITTAKWLTPNGRWIHNIGLKPDIEIEPATEGTTDVQLDKALEELN